MRKTTLLGMAAGLALAFTGFTNAGAQEPLNAQSVIDRAEIEELLTAYYNHFGGNMGDSLGQFYTEDGEMVLGTTSFKGIAAIKGMYASVPADAPQRKAYALNILIGNPSIKVTGDTATARLVYTEYAVEKEGDAPHIITMGREFDWLVKQDGKWLIQKRQIMGPKGKPDNWED